MSINNDVVGMPPIEAWQPLTLQNGWAIQNSSGSLGAIAPPSFYKDPMGIVRCRGRIKDGLAGQTAFVLPAGYRPEFFIRTAVIYSSTSAVLTEYCNLAVDGRVIFNVTTNVWIQLEGIQFRAA